MAGKVMHRPVVAVPSRCDQRRFQMLCRQLVVEAVKAVDRCFELGGHAEIMGIRNNWLKIAKREGYFSIISG